MTHSPEWLKFNSNNNKCWQGYRAMTGGQVHMTILEDCLASPTNAGHPHSLRPKLIPKYIPNSNVCT